MEKVSNWMHVDVFTVDQAAALWCGFDPTKVSIVSHHNPPEFTAAKQLLVGAIVSKEIFCDSSRNHLHAIGNFGESLIPRPELEKLARKKGVFPAFLFDTLAPFEATPAQGFSTAPLSATVVRQTPTEPAASRGGRPQEYDWDAFALEIIRKANAPDGLPESQAALVREMLQWFIDRYGCEPAESSVKARTSKIYRYLNDEKSKAKNSGS